ncbi:WxL domain-containing protein [Lactococcus nasutitermitis]|uniref:WxL domain-containing protein n=1 Tax=Lactococcus nasutitermitis TaxID=1652957 RepID=A0ABV9JFV7_9LACT|nr:WxL domain-containing protein [Lactococcus nasutitermitis]
MTKAAIKLVSFATLGLLAASTTATIANADGATYNSTGTITYQASTAVTPPVDPSDPTTPVTPTNPDGSDLTPDQAGTAGPLSIDFASSFDFGTQDITSSNMTYYAAAQKLSDGSTRDNYVQVTDNRGTLTGWSLSVEQGDFETSAGDVLKGAQITLGDGAIASASETPADVSAATTTLTPGTASGTILGATDGNGAGTNLLNFGDADGTTNSDTAVSLFVPGSSTKLAQTYTADLTWTLSDTPAQ